MRPLDAKPLGAACVAHQRRHITELVSQRHLHLQVANFMEGSEGISVNMGGIQASQAVMIRSADVRSSASAS